MAISASRTGCVWKGLVVMKSKNRDFARHLPPETWTDAERHLWYELRRRNLDGCRFRRQALVGGLCC